MLREGASLKVSCFFLKLLIYTLIERSSACFRVKLEAEVDGEGWLCAPLQSTV